MGRLNDWLVDQTRVYGRTWKMELFGRVCFLANECMVSAGKELRKVLLGGHVTQKGTK
jgi:hypothetical protein